MAIPHGQVFLVKQIQTRDGFAKGAQTGILRSPAQHLGVFMFLGDVNEQSIEGFDTALALRRLGFGAWPFTALVRGVTDSLQALTTHLADQQTRDENEDQLLAQALSALAAAQSFIQASNGPRK